MKEQLNRRAMILIGLTLVAGLFLAFDFLSRSKAPRPSPRDEAAGDAHLPAFLLRPTRRKA